LAQQHRERGTFYLRRGKPQATAGPRTESRFETALPKGPKTAAQCWEGISKIREEPSNSKNRRGGPKVRGGTQKTPPREMTSLSGEQKEKAPVGSHGPRNDPRGPFVSLFIDAPPKTQEPHVWGPGGRPTREGF